MPAPQQQVKPATQTTTQSQATAPAMSDFQKLLEKKSVEYTPFGATEKLRLTVAMVRDQLAEPTKRGHKPTDRDCIKFIMMCQARALNPFEGDAFLLGYDGQEGPKFSLITAIQAFLKRAEVHPQYDGYQSGVILLKEDNQVEEREGDFHLPDETVVGGWCRVYIKGRTHPVYRRLRLNRFNKGFGVWKDDPAGMIVKCAEADGLRSAFPTTIGGLYLREEMEMLPVKPEMLRPLFEAIKTPETKEEPSNGHTEPTPATPEAPQTPEPEPKQVAQEEPPPEESDFSYVKAVRDLAKIAKIAEGTLLGYLAETGATDGAVSTLEELSLQFPQVLRSVNDNWANVAEKVKEAKQRK